MYFKRSAYVLIATVTLAMLSGCKDKEDIQVYRVSKDDDAIATAAPANAGATDTPGMPGTPTEDAGAGAASSLTGAPPSDWVAQAPSAMRQASYLVKGQNGATADVSLVALGGPAGGTLENVNRWLTQLGQPGITDDKLKEIAQDVATPLGDVLIVDLQGLPTGADASKDGRILGGIASSDANTYFFKMRGNSALVESQKDDFLKWVGSVHPSEAPDSPAATTTVDAAPPAAPDAGANPQQPQIAYTAPDGWKSAPATAMRYASFTVAGDNGASADISVSVFTGEAGGDLANVNRWRGQLALDPVTDADLKSLVTPVTSGGGDIQTVDMAGATSRVLAGWIHNQGQTWFFKLSGPDPLVTAQKVNFVKFLQSIQFKS